MTITPCANASVTVDKALREATRRLMPVLAPALGADASALGAGIDALPDHARRDAEWLMAAALGVSRSDMLLRHMTAPVPAMFAKFLTRRLAHEPIAYILGEADFFGLNFSVGPNVLIPRVDSECLIEVAQCSFAQLGTAPARILDLGTGSACLLLAGLSLFDQAFGVGIDRSEAALVFARVNAERLGFGERVSWRCTDWHQAAAIQKLGRFDLVLANPPYVSTRFDLDPGVRDYEPPSALFAGAEGLDDYRVLIPQLPGLLAPQALAIVEIGYDQAEAVATLARDVGMESLLHRDLAGRPRALELWMKVPKSKT